MAKVSRANLTQYFKKGNKPTEDQFKDLIESNLNLLDSGITILGTGDNSNIRIGLDTNEPKEKLDINGNLCVDGVLQLKERSGDYTGEIGAIRWTGSDLAVKVKADDVAGSWECLAVNSAGIINEIIKKDEKTKSIGIGITEQTPQSKLHLRKGPVLIDNTENPAEKSMLSVQGKLGIGTFDYPSDAHQIESNLQINATYHKELTGTVSGTQNRFDKEVLIGNITGTQGGNELEITGAFSNPGLVRNQKIQVSDANGTYIYTITDVDESNNRFILIENLLSTITNGTISVFELTGEGTDFRNETTVGQKIKIDTHTYTITKIEDDTKIWLNEALIEDVTDEPIFIASDILKIKDVGDQEVFTIDKNGNTSIQGTTTLHNNFKVQSNGTDKFSVASKW